MHIYCIYRQDLTQKRKDTHTETLVLTRYVPENMVSFYIGVCEEMAEQKNYETMNTDRMERLQDSLPWIVLAAALFVIFRFVIGVAVVDGDSMDPRLTRGSLVLYYRMVKEYEPGESGGSKRSAEMKWICGRGAFISTEQNTRTIRRREQRFGKAVLLSIPTG